MGDDREEIARLIHFMHGDGLSAEDAMKPTNDAHWQHWKETGACRDAWNAADAILARAQGPGPGEAVAWRWRHTAAVYGDVSTTPGPWKDGHPPKHSAAEAWKYEVQKLVAIAATPTREA